MNKQRLIKGFLLQAACILLLSLALPSQAEIYKYTDKAGVPNFTDDINKIPPQYRHQIPATSVKFASAWAIEKRTIKYKVTSQMWDFRQEKAVATPEPVLKKIRKVLDLWQSVPEAGLRFEFAGFSGSGYALPKGIPDDGALHFVLNGSHSFGSGVSGSGGFEGALPHNYRKGYVFINTAVGYYPLSLKTLVHEVGHALGIPEHAADCGMVMHCGTPAWSDHEFLVLSMQDRADLIHVWNRAAVRTISGKVITKKSKFMNVYAVDAVNGRTFSARTNSKGEYTIPILYPGLYKIFAKGDEAGAFHNPVAQSPSWYVSAGNSSNDPDRGQRIELLRNDIRGIDISVIDQRVPFNFWWSGPLYLYQSKRQRNTAEAGTLVASFLRPGHTAQFRLQFNEGKIVSIEPFGTRPDCEVTAFDPMTTNITIKANKDAVEGHRLFIAKDKGEIIQAGLVGVQVIKGKLPSLLLQSVEEQISGKADIDALDPEYWKK